MIEHNIYLNNIQWFNEIVVIKKIEKYFYWNLRLSIYSRRIFALKISFKYFFVYDEKYTKSHPVCIQQEVSLC